MPAPGRNRLLLFQSGGISYLLRATFSTDIAAPLPASLPVDVGGPLTVVDTNSIISQSGGVLLINGTPAASDGIRSAATFARLAGRALLFQRPGYTSGSTNWRVGWSSAGGVDLGIGLSSATALSIRDNGSAIDTVTLGSGVWELLSVQRGTGAFLFGRIGSSGPFTLLWVGNAGTTTPLYPLVTSSNTSAGNFTLDNLRVLDLGTYDSRFATDYGLALNRSTFTAANGTALTAIVPEAGGAWTQRNASTWQITSNKLVPLSVPGGEPTAVATVVSTSADIVIEATVNTSSVASATAAGIVLRYTDDNNFWVISLVGNSNVLVIVERNAGVYTARATTSVTVATGTDYRIVVVAEGSTITAYVANGNKITYASAALNQAVTTHGVRAVATTWSVDDFVIYPRTIALRGDI